MNLNEIIINKNNRASNPRWTKTNRIEVMGPPLKPAPKKKNSTHNSSSLNWGKCHKSILEQSSSNYTSNSTSVELETKTILAITEGRGEARCEVGIAALNISPPNLILCQISDTHSYVNTLTKINIFNPSEIIFPKTFVTNENRLVELIKTHFPNVKLTSIPRNAFNKSNGIDRLNQLILPELHSVLFAIQHRYYALSAACAALQHVQGVLNVYFRNGSIKLQYEESEGFSIIDIWTADRLELVTCQRPAQATKYSTLFGVVNHCVTKVGSRALRSTILQPPYSVPYIEERLNCVTELVRRPELLITIQGVLGKVTNIHQLLTITTLSSHVDSNMSTRRLNYLLLLNSLLDLVTPLKDILKNMKNGFFVELTDLLGSDSFIHIKNSLKTIIHTDAYETKGQIGDTQRCFLIKSGINGLLDLTRETYSKRVDEMRKYVSDLGKKYNLQLTLGNNNTKGYHIVFRLNNQQKKFFKKSDLPTEFYQVYRLAGCFTMKTLKLVDLSTRIDYLLDDIIKISNIMVNKILIEVNKYIALFYKICEFVAKLDMLQSLAQASLGDSYVRPSFSDFTEIKHAHHPLLDFLCSNRPVPNNIEACKNYNMHVITGPNGSGKSIYIRQVVLLQVLAQIGCYVPAKSAIFKPADKIYARVGFDDNMESGASTFTLEMREISYILKTMTDNSLIIIDELCRSTCIDEGTALALSICERFLVSSAFVYVTTHFTEFQKLYDMYYNVKIWQLQTIASGNNPESTVLDFRYTIIPGMTTLERYGIYLVRGIWPEAIIKDIDKMIKKIKKAPQTGKHFKLDEKLRLKYDLEAKIDKLRSMGKFTKTRLYKMLNEYQNNLEKFNVSLSLNLDFSDNRNEVNHTLLNHSGGGNFLLDRPPSHHLQEVIRLPEDSINSTSVGGDPELNCNLIQNRFESFFTPDHSPSHHLQKGIRIPEDSINSTSVGGDPELNCNLIHNRFENVFTPESGILTQNSCPEMLKDDASIREFSNLLKESSTNILVPEVCLYSGSDYFYLPDYEPIQTPQFSPEPHPQNYTFEEAGEKLDFLDPEALDALEDFHSVREEFFSIDMEESDELNNCNKNIISSKENIGGKRTEISPLRKIIYNNNNGENKADSYEEELESCSESSLKFSFDDHERTQVKTTDNCTSVTSLKVQNVNNFTTSKEPEDSTTPESVIKVPPENVPENVTTSSPSGSVAQLNGSVSLNKTYNNDLHLFPNVIVISGPDDTSISFGSFDDSLNVNHQNYVTNNDSDDRITEKSFVSVEVETLLDVNTTIKFGLNSSKEKIENNSSSSHSSEEQYDTCVESPEKITLKRCKVVLERRASVEILHRNYPLENVNLPAPENLGAHDERKTESNVNPNQERQNFETGTNHSEITVTKKTSSHKINVSSSLSSTNLINSSNTSSLLRNVSSSNFKPPSSTNLINTSNISSPAHNVISGNSKPSSSSKLINTSSISSSPNHVFSSNSKLLSSSNIINSSKNHSSSSLKESDVSQEQQSKTVKTLGIRKRKLPNTTIKTKRFKPPLKLSKQEIQDEFNEQTRKLLEECQSPSTSSKDISKCYEKIINRPSVKQVQDAVELAVARRTYQGEIVVVPQVPKKTRKRKAFLPLLRSSSAEHVDLQIFSDKNSKPFEEFLKSDVKNYKLFNFDLINSSNSGCTSSPIVKKCNVFEETSKEELFNKHSDLWSLTPEGYYKNNKQSIDSILNKYLKESIVESSQECQKSGPTQRNKSIFQS